MGVSSHECEDLRDNNMMSNFNPQGEGGKSPYSPQSCGRRAALTHLIDIYNKQRDMESASAHADLATGQDIRGLSRTSRLTKSAIGGILYPEALHVAGARPT